MQTSGPATQPNSQPDTEGQQQAHKYIWGPELATSHGSADYSPGQSEERVKAKQNGVSNPLTAGGDVETRLLSSADDPEKAPSFGKNCVVENGACNTEGCQGVHKNGPARPQWNKELEFVLAAVGNAVGLGNLWRFPYLCYASGGGAFLIPYLIMLILCGIPLLFMELSVGQWTSQGPVGAMQKLSPFWQGAGMATVMLSFLLCTYYNVIMTWALYYFGASFQNPLPWSNCDNEWNTDKCWDDYSENASFYRPNDTVSPSQEYYENQVLKQSSGIEEQGTIVWQLAVLLLFAWALVYFSIWKGVQWTGKVVYFTATFPYVVIILLIARGVTLPGAGIGIDFYINPRWELLKEPKVWVNAAAQNFNSIGIAFGSMIAFASYNKKEVNLFRNSLIICLINSGTSVLAGFAVFSILGNIAYKQGANVEDVVTDGPGLVFIVYPEAFVTMPAGVAQLFSVLFFFMVICLAIDSQFASVEVVITTVMDHWGREVMRLFRYKELFVLAVCILAYFMGFPNITNGGIYFFKIIDYYSSGISLMLVALCQVCAIAWFYGASRLARNVKEMTGSKVNVFFLVCWYGLSPLLITVIMLFNWIKYSPVMYGDYSYPQWALGLGWFLASLSLVCIPIGIVYALVNTEGASLYKRLRSSLRSYYDTNYDLDTDDLSDSVEGYALSDKAIYKVPIQNGYDSYPMETKKPI